MSLPRLWRGRRARLMACLIGNGVAQASIAVATAVLVRLAFDRSTAGADGSRAWSFAEIMGLLGAALLIALILRVVERIHAARLGEDYVARIRLRLFKALATDPISAAQRRGVGPTMLRFVTDLTAVQRWIREGLARLIVGSLATLGGLAALYLISPAIGIAVSTVVVVALLMGAFLYRPLTDRVRAARRQRARLASHVGDRLGALDVVKTSGRERREQRLLARHSGRLAEAAVARAGIAGLVQVLPDAALGAATLAVLVIGGLQLSAGETTQGTLLAALLLIGAIAPQARALGRAFEHWTNYKVATVKLRQILRTARGAKRPRRRLAISSGELALDDVAVDDRLESVSATVAAGTRVAIIGPSGSGKSTLLWLAGSRQRPDRGRVLLDGVDIAEVDPRSFARHVGTASSEMPLLKGSVRRNLCYRFGRASEADIAEVCRLCGIEDAIVALPQGLDFRLTEQAAHLPRGLRHRLILARAVMGNPAMLLLDEQDLGADPAGRAAIDRVLSARSGTTLMLTQDPERARGADVLWYLEAGRLREAGPPAALIIANGRAAHFLRSLERDAADAAPAATVVRLEPLQRPPASVGSATRPHSLRPS